MPFDDPTTRVEVGDRHAGLRSLAYALRHPELWPKGFGWYWPDPERCGIGLGMALGVEMSLDALGITLAEWRGIFCTMSAGSPFRRLAQFFFGGSPLPRPKDIAYEIDKVLARYDRE